MSNEEDLARIGEDDEELTASQLKSFFEEAKEVQDLITSLRDRSLSLDHHDQNANKIIKILEKYQEQPHLIDSSMEDIVSPLMEMIRGIIQHSKGADSNNNNSDPDKARYTHILFKLVYVITKVRGYKAVVKLFPHEVSDLQPTFEFLAAQNPKDYSTWEIRYVLLLWLSIIILIPFQLSTVDSASLADAGQNEQVSIISRMIETSKSFLGDPGKTREGASIFLSRLLTRPDMKTHLTSFLLWCKESLETTDPFLGAGVNTVLAAIFKVGKRHELLDKIPTVFSAVLQSSSTQQNGLQRKLLIKLVQRIGLTYLKPRVVSWRYQRGSRSLLKNLESPCTVVAKSPTDEQQNEGEEEEEELENISEIEEVITTLLGGLGDKDTIVRWSAAKGIGRITMRLSKDMGHEVVGSVLSLFAEREGDSSWHGGCLALAELARRGLLLPESLEEVVPVILKALQYDVQKGAHSVGAHVRDAACYVCWAFARAYSPEVMQPFVASLSRGLIITSVFDREVNCRRAAAAAFQENVGRQGNFPHGIDILTTADYFTLSNRTNAYLQISVYIAQFAEYCHGLIDHLVSVKIGHWDQSIRELASKALHNLAQRDPKYMAEVVLPKLIPTTLSKELNIRHGSVLAAAEVMLALSEIGETFSDDLQKQLRNVVINIENARLYRGKGGEIMREAVCRFIECMALSHIALPEFIEVQAAVGNRKLKTKTTTRFQETIDENIKHPNEKISDMASLAMQAFSNEYYKENNADIEKKIIDKYIHALKTDDNPASRRGHAIVLGRIPKHLIAHKFTEAADALIQSTQVEEIPEKRDAETRRNAVNALIGLCETVGTVAADERNGVNLSNARKVFDALLKATEDYSLDNRGDVGSWTRDAAMQALERLTYLLCRADEKLLTQTDYETKTSDRFFTPEMCSNMVCALLKQLMEKIDRVRDTAGNVFQRIVTSSSPRVPFIPHRDRIEELLERQPVLDWSAPSVTFPLFINLLDYDVYRYPMLAGLAVSIGGMSEHVVRHSGTACAQYIKAKLADKDAGVDFVEKIACTLTQIFKDNIKNDRVTLPLLKTFDLLFQNGSFDALQPERSEFPKALHAHTKAEISQTKDVIKLLSSIEVFCGLTRYSQPVRNAALQTLLALLVSKFPRVRKVTAERLYSTVMIHDGIVPDEILDDVLAILSETNWDGKPEETRPNRMRLYELLNIPKPQPKLEGASAPAPAPARPRPANNNNDSGSYMDLVKETGY